MFTPAKTLMVSVVIIVVVVAMLNKEKVGEVQAPLGIAKLLKKVPRRKRVRKPVAHLKPKQVKSLGSKNKNVPRKEPLNCDNVALDSPNFEKCATLGSGRTVLPGNPVNTAHNINTAFVQDNFVPVGNPFSKSLENDFAKDGFMGASLITKAKAPISEEGAKAFPFATKSSGRDGGLKKAPFRSTLTLGAAVSPSANLGMSQEEVEQSAKRLDETNVVQQTTGGQLNLLVHGA